MGAVIDMVRCPYCETYIVEEPELVCERCVDKVAADLACVDLINSITELEKLGKEALCIRAQLLTEALSRLTALNKTLEDDGSSTNTPCVKLET